MLFVVVVCFIARQHRKGLSRRDATADNGGSSSYRDSSSSLVNVGAGRAEKYYITLPQAIFSKGGLVREAPQAYLPYWQGLPWHGPG